MNDFLLHATTIFLGFFAIMNPIANVPIFLGLTEGEEQKTTEAVARRSLLIAFLIVAVFSMLGKFVFELFGITLPAFRITGGLLVSLIGYHMLQGKNSRVNHLTEENQQKCMEAALSVAVTPLAIPILAGPGTIATAMSFSAEMVTTIAMFGVLCVITYLLFIFGRKFTTFIGDGALAVITRIMGMILAVIGTQMVIAGVKGAFHLAP